MFQLLMFGIGLIVSVTVYQKYYYWKRARNSKKFREAGKNIQPIIEASYCYALDRVLQPCSD